MLSASSSEFDKDGKPTRLMITKMVLENFKSYAGIQEIGPFHKRFSSIVGPNGSGKSNVIDALLFVFGKRAKQLRLSKVAELIHKSSGFPNLEYARCSVHFQRIYDNEDDDDAFEVVPDSEFIVTRKALLDSTSNYYIDDKKSTYSEVGVVLRQHGIDLDNNRFLILQGEVELIAMMKPKGDNKNDEGLLEYLEDIIGSNKYLERIEEVSKSLDELNEQRIARMNTLKQAEKERDNLSSSKEEAENFLNKEKNLRSKQNILFQVEETIDLKKLELLNKKLEETATKLEAEKLKFAEHNESMASKEITYKSVLNDYNSIEKELHTSYDEFNDFEKRDLKLIEDKKHCDKQIKKIQSLISENLKKEKDCLTSSELLIKKITEKNDLLKTVEERRTEEEIKLEEILSSLKTETAELRMELEVSQEKLSDAERGVSSLTSDKEEITMSINLIKSRSVNSSKLLKNMNDKMNSILTERESNSKNISDLTTEKNLLEKKFKSNTSLLSKHENDEVSLQDKLRKAVTNCEEAKISMSMQSSGATGVSAKIMEATKKGGPLANVGVVGRLGDLGFIESKYDTSISTACGFLDHILVESNEGGQACIKYLKENNIGRCNFILLDQMVQYVKNMERIVNVPSGTSRLFDLVTPKDEQYRAAFYMALRDTIVAPDLDTAVRVAYDGDKVVWKVVTIDGNIIDTSGSMSGGGKQAKSGGMLTKSSNSAAASIKVSKITEEVTQAQIQELELNVEKLTKSLSECRNLKNNLERDLRDAKSRLKAISSEIEKTELVLTRFNSQEIELSQKIQITEKETVITKSEIKEIAELEAQFDAIEAEIHQKSPNLTPLKCEVTLLQRKIKDVGGTELSRSQSNIDIFNSQYETITSKLATMKVDEKTYRRDATKANNLLLKAKEDEEKLNEKLAQIEIESTKIVDEADIVNQKLQDAKQKMEQMEGELKSITEEYEDIKSKVDELKKTEFDITAAYKKVTEDVKDCSDNCKIWKEKLGKLRSQHLMVQQDNDAKVKEAIASLPASSKTINSDNDMDSEVIYEHLKILCADELEKATTDRDEIYEEISVLEKEINKIKKDVNLTSIMDYIKKDAQYKARLFDLEAITEIRNEARSNFEDLRRQRLEEFMSGFGIITLKLKEMYQMITLGGDAELELVDSLDPFSEGNL
jgi:structural maintenance of chromosome 4